MDKIKRKMFYRHLLRCIPLERVKNIKEIINKYDMWYDVIKRYIKKIKNNGCWVGNIVEVSINYCSNQKPRVMNKFIITRFKLTRNWKCEEKK